MSEDDRQTLLADHFQAVSALEDEYRELTATAEASLREQQKLQVARRLNDIAQRHAVDATAVLQAQVMRAARPEVAGTEVAGETLVVEDVGEVTNAADIVKEADAQRELEDQRAVLAKELELEGEAEVAVLEETLVQRREAEIERAQAQLAAALADVDTEESRSQILAEHRENVALLEETLTLEATRQRRELKERLAARRKRLAIKKGQLSTQRVTEEQAMAIRHVREREDLEAALEAETDRRTADIRKEFVDRYDAETATLRCQYEDAVAVAKSPTEAATIADEMDRAIQARMAVLAREEEQKISRVETEMAAKRVRELSALDGRHRSEKSGAHAISTEEAEAEDAKDEAEIAALESHVAADIEEALQKANVALEEELATVDSDEVRNKLMAEFEENSKSLQDSMLIDAERQKTDLRKRLEERRARRAAKKASRENLKSEQEKEFEALAEKHRKERERLEEEARLEAERAERELKDAIERKERVQFATRLPLPTCRYTATFFSVPLSLELLLVAGPAMLREITQTCMLCMRAGEASAHR
jgi:fused signal recognition particle receptor